jgi:hypothetical protein
MRVRFLRTQEGCPVVLRFKAVGKNPRATGYLFGIDHINLK